MADHNTLKAQADEALALGTPYLTLAEGWNVIDETDGITTSIHPSEIERVARIQGNVNKNPEFCVKFIGGNLAKLRETHLEGHVACEYVQSFEDRSHVVREASSYEGIGDIVQYKYYSTRIGEDGSLTIVATTAKVPEYPEGTARLNFWVLRVTPIEGGSHFNLVMQSQSSAHVEEAVKGHIAQVLKKFYSGVVADLRAAAE